MTPGPRALYPELKRRFNGGNNGGLFLSHREAAYPLEAMDRRAPDIAHHAPLGGHLLVVFRLQPVGGPGRAVGRKNRVHYLVPLPAQHGGLRPDGRATEGHGTSLAS